MSNGLKRDKLIEEDSRVNKGGKVMSKKVTLKKAQTKGGADLNKAVNK